MGNLSLFTNANQHQRRLLNRSGDYYIELNLIFKFQRLSTVEGSEITP